MTPHRLVLVVLALATACNPPKCEEARPMLPALARIEPVIAAPLGIGLTGIPPCDEYIARFERCIAEHAEPADRTGMRETLAATADAWRAIATGPGREYLPGMCDIAIAGGRAAIATMGCKWNSERQW